MSALCICRAISILLNQSTEERIQFNQLRWFVELFCMSCIKKTHEVHFKKWSIECKNWISDETIRFASRLWQCSSCINSDGQGIEFFFSKYEEEHTSINNQNSVTIHDSRYPVSNAENRTRCKVFSNNLLNHRIGVWIDWSCCFIHKQNTALL